MKVTNLYVFMRSQDFRYNLWFVPIKATLDAEIANVALDFEIDFVNTTVNYTDPVTGLTQLRTVP